MSNDPAISAGETVNPPPEAPTDVPAPEEKEPVAQEAEETKEEAAEPEKKEFRSGYARQKHRLQRAIAAQEQLHAENQALKKQLDTVKSSGVEELKRPKMTDFTDMDAYDDAMDKYRLEQTRRVLAEQRAEDEQRQSQSKQQESQGEVLDDFFERWNELEKQMPDAKESVDKLYATIGPLNPTVRDLIADAENGEVILYFISKNPGIGRQLNSADPITAAKMIGNLEEKTKLPPPKTQSAAPPPINSPKGGASAPKDYFQVAKKDDATEYIKMRLAQEKTKD
jgi:hypothetical protein